MPLNLSNMYPAAHSPQQSLDIWATPISVLNTGESARELNELLVKDALKERSIDRRTTDVSRTGIDVWQSALNMQARYTSFGQLKELLKEAVFAIMSESGFGTDLNKYDVSSLWVNITMSGSAFHLPHIHGHGTTVWTGVYYPTTLLVKGEMQRPENLNDSVMDNLRPTSTPKPGDLIIYDPASIIKRIATPVHVDRYPYYGQEFCFTPREGAAILFPAWVEHSTAPHGQQGCERMSISFAVLVHEY